MATAPAGKSVSLEVVDIVNPNELNFILGHGAAAIGMQACWQLRWCAYCSCTRCADAIG
jgi:hypothetical protein